MQNRREFRDSNGWLIGFATGNAAGEDFFDATGARVRYTAAGDTYVNGGAQVFQGAFGEFLFGRHKDRP